MAFRDIRQFADALEKAGELVRIKQPVHWELEAGAVSRRAYETRAPATFFENIVDYPPGFRILGGSLATYPRVAIALGLPPTASIKEIQDEHERRDQHPIKPVVVKDAPCKENILIGDKVDLNLLPTPMIHDGDGGRYIGTWDIIVSKDPDSDWTNWGMYRFMIHNKRSMVGDPSSQSHLGLVFFQKYHPQNKPMPMALVIGADPISHMVATAGYGIGVSEVDYAGALRQEPVELIKCETSDLLVPAHSEIVIEGELFTDMNLPEGPFGEYPGFRTQGARPGMACRVNAITYRNNPILTMISLGIPLDDSSLTGAMTTAMAIKRRLKRHGIPVIDVHAPPESATHIIVVSVKTGGINTASQVIDVITARRATVSKVIVVNEDVNPFNLAEVFHALGTRCHPIRGMKVKPIEGRANRLTPCYSFEERKRMDGAAALFDCTWPLEWSPDTDIPIKSSFSDIYPKEVQEKVVKNWKNYGLK